MTEVPNALSMRPNWILWRHVERDGKSAKLPISALSMKAARTDDPSTWSTLEIAVAVMRRNFPLQLGFVFGRDDDLFGIDMDSCITDDDALTPWAKKMLAFFPTYAEVSPSQTGVKLFGIGRHQERGLCMTIGDAVAGEKRAAIEVYGWGRYFAFTGLKLIGSPAQLQDCQRPLETLVARIKAQRPTVPTKPSPSSHSPVNGPSLIYRARRYLQMIGPAISEQQGGKKTFRAACVLVREIGISPDWAFQLMTDWNAGCLPPWSEAELWHKLRDAAKGTQFEQ